MVGYNKIIQVVDSIGGTPKPNCLYLILKPSLNKFVIQATDKNGIPVDQHLPETPSSGVASVTGSGVTGSSSNPVVDISTFVSTQPGNLVSLSTQDGKIRVNEIKSPDGSLTIVHEVDEIQIQLSTYLSELITSAIQPGRNISELSNDKGFITDADLPGTKDEFNTTLTDGNFLFEGDIIVPNNTDELSEGAVNLYHTTHRVLTTALAGLSTAIDGNIDSDDTILKAFGKIKNSLDGIGNMLTTTPVVLANRMTSATTTASETVADAVLISGLGNSWSIDANFRAKSDGTTSLSQVRFYLNDTPDLSGTPVQLAQNQPVQASQRMGSLDRTFSYFDGVLRGSVPTSNHFSDESSGANGTPLSLEVDLNSGDKYLIAVIARGGTAGDTITGDLFKVIWFPSK